MTGKKILVIDDEEHIRDSLGFILNKLGYSVRTEGDATKVFQILDHEKFDIIVSDVRMPKLDGRELSKLVQEKYPEIQVILISGYQNEDIVNGQFHGSCKPLRYLNKPFSMSELIGCLESF